MMKRAGSSAIAGILGLLAIVGLARNAFADGPFIGGSFVTTVTDSSGAFASRGVITLHSDHTMSVIDSGQGGPTFFFSSQLGSWGLGKSGFIGRTIDFDYPPDADVARLDYTISFTQGGSEITGTITLTSFPLTGNPLGGGGTVEGTFTFVGFLVTP
jgi:hypothetical protein